MLIRSLRQLCALLGSFVFITCTILLLRFYDSGSIALPYVADRWSPGDLFNGRTSTPDFTSSSSSSQGSALDEDEFDLNVYGKPVHEIFSISGKNGKYFPIRWGDYEAINPNIIPHPQKEDTWIIIAQQQRTDVWNTVWFAELWCEAQFKNGALECLKSPLTVPIAPTLGHDQSCLGDLAFLAFNVGPHDARAFYGPDAPYIIYGSQSKFNCFGLFIQDVRYITDWGVVAAKYSDPRVKFRQQTELQRPAPLGAVEKNWFVFWDTAGQMYAHYDVFPKRAFAAIAPDGSSGPDLAANTYMEDGKCIAKYMPKLPEKLESIHQATNSLSVTMCKRSDPSCTPTDANTFIMTIFQHKTFYNWHGAYEPYVMLFKRNAPFGIHAISEKPLWIHGRGKATRPKEIDASMWEETQMFYVTSVSWKAHDSKYHGYIDDEIFLGFGIEDKTSAGIDVVVGDILEHLGMCSEVDAIVAPPSSPIIPTHPNGIGDASDVMNLATAGLAADLESENAANKGPFGGLFL